MEILPCYRYSNEAVRRHDITVYLFQVFDNCEFISDVSLIILVPELLVMGSQKIDDIEKTAGLDFISPAETICDTGTQSTEDAKPHVSRGMHRSQK